MSDCLVQVYDEDGEEYGLYRYDTEKVSRDYVYSVIPALFALHGESEEFDEALRYWGIERIYIEQEIDLPCAKKRDPLLMGCWVKFKDETEQVYRTFGVGTFDATVDDSVFFWVDDFNSLVGLMSDKSEEDFIITSLGEVVC